MKFDYTEAESKLEAVTKNKVPQGGGRKEAFPLCLWVKAFLTLAFGVAKKELYVRCCIGPPSRKNAVEEKYSPQPKSFRELWINYTL